MADDNKGKGWHGDPKGHAEAGREGGEKVKEEKGPDFYSQIGSKGGQAAQKSGNVHELTEEERSEGGSHSGGNFAKDPQRASEAGKKGGSN